MHNLPRIIDPGKNIQRKLGALAPSFFYVSICVMQTKDLVEQLQRVEPRIFMRDTRFDAAIYIRMGGSYIQKISEDIWSPEDQMLCAVPKGTILYSRKESKERGYTSIIKDVPHNGLKEVKSFLLKYGYNKAAAIVPV